MENEATSIRNVEKNSQYFLCFGGKCVLLNRIFPDFGTLSQAQYCLYSGHIYAARRQYHELEGGKTAEP